MPEAVRFVAKGDSDELLDIYAPYVQNTVITLELKPPTPAEYKNRVAAISAFYPYLVHEIDGAITGYAYATRHHEREGYCYGTSVSIYLRPEFHSRGIGRRLYAALFTLLKAQGVRVAYAVITLPNMKSEGMHTAFGFEAVGIFRKTGYKHGKWHDVVWMEKFLNEFPASPEPLRPVHELPAEFLETVLSKEEA